MNSRRRLRSLEPRWWWQKHPFIAVGVMVTLFTVILFILVVHAFGWDWTGFNEHIGSNVQQYRPAKTLWDWLNLLGVFAIPVVVGIGAAWYTAQQERVSNRENIDNQREATLQAYIDKMSELLLEKHLLGSSPRDEVRIIARVRTITVLLQLDTRRIGYVFAFLREAGLMSNKPDSSIVSLSQADLIGADFSGAILYGVDLSGAILKEADFSRATLYKATLSGAILYQADFSGANLYKADLSQADLKGANLVGADLKANLSGTDLKGANLRDANFAGADLSEANLAGATMTEKQLKEAKSLRGVTVPAEFAV